MHEMGPETVTKHVGRIASGLIFSMLVVWPLGAAGGDADLTRLLKGIEQRYNGAKSLRVEFTESYSVQGRPRQSEAGTLTLRKPGRMRWEYRNPSGKLFISDGKQVYLYTPQDHRVERMKLKDSEDYRAPLAFLLGKLDFSRDFQDFQWKAEGSDYHLTAKAKSQQAPYEKIEMLAKPDYEIRRLVVTGQDQSVLTFDFEGEKLNPPVDNAMFRFQMPAGATFADEQGGD